MIAPFWPRVSSIILHTVQLWWVIGLSWGNMSTKPNSEILCFNFVNFIYFLHFNKDLQCKFTNYSTSRTLNNTTRTMPLGWICYDHLWHHKKKDNINMNTHVRIFLPHFKVCWTDVMYLDLWALFANPFLLST